jgi:glycosyltransferase involved in cell wall biosynthesis
MKLILISKTNPFSNLGASSNRILGLLKELDTLGNQITILIIGGYYNKAELAEYSNEGTREGIHYLYLSGRKNISIWERRFSEYITKGIDWLFLRRKFHKYIDKIDENVIVWIRYDLTSFKIAKNKNKKSNVKYFMELNEYPDIHLYNNSTKYPWQMSSANTTTNYFVNNFLPSIDGLALMTNALIEYYGKRVSKDLRILHLPMTVDLSRFNLLKNYPKLPNIDSPYIAFVGSMNDSKDGVNILIEAFAKTAELFPKYSLCIFGFWTYDTPMHLKRIRQLGLENRIIYSKPIASNEVTRLIMNADLLVLPRPDSYQAKGGFPTKLGEYLATSKPVICTRVGEIPDYLEDENSVFFCEPSSVESLVISLKKVVEDGKRAKEVGKNGRKIAETIFSTSVQAKRLNDFLITFFD